MFRSSQVPKDVPEYNQTYLTQEEAEKTVTTLHQDLIIKLSQRKLKVHSRIGSGQPTQSFKDERRNQALKEPLLEKDEQFLSTCYQKVEIYHRDSWKVRHYTAVFLTDHANLILIKTSFPDHTHPTAIHKTIVGGKKVGRFAIQRLKQFRPSVTHYSKLTRELIPVCKEILRGWDDEEDLLDEEDPLNVAH